MNKQVSPKIIALTFGILVISFSIAFYVVAWQEPTEAPPEGNVSAPLNVSDIGQIKEGNLVVNALGTSAMSGNAVIINSGGNLCLGTDCRDSWPTTGIVTTYQMEASGYKIYNSEKGYDEYFSKTVLYDCPSGSEIVNISCTQNMVNTRGTVNCTEGSCGTGTPTNSCSCSGSDNKATLKASIVEAQLFEGDCPGGGGPCQGVYLKDYCYPHKTYSPWYASVEYKYECYIPSGTPQCTMEFQCGIKQTVGQ